MDTDYRFVSMQAFEEKYASGGFISTREVAGERYGATMPTAERVNMVIVDPPGVHMIRSNLSHLVASGTLSFVHFLLDTPWELCAERIIQDGSNMKRLERLLREFDNDTYDLGWLDTALFARLDGTLTVSDLTAEVSTRIFTAGGRI